MVVFGAATSNPRMERGDGSFVLATVPSNSIRGEPPKPGCVVPSIVTGLVMNGSAVVGWIT